MVLVPHSLVRDLALQERRIPRKPLQVLQRWLFETSFLYDGEYHRRVRISPLFLSTLHTLLDIAHAYPLHYSLASLEHFAHFQPHFVDAAFRLCDFGKSERVIITESDCALLALERQFLADNAPWATQLTITRHCQLPGAQRADLKELKEILYNTPFRYALCESFPLEILQRTKEQRRLF